MKMSQKTRGEVLPKMRERYARRGREGRSQLLNEVCEQFGYERKYAIKLLRMKLPPARGRPKPGPARLYGADVERVVKALWLASDQLCGKRLAPALALWLPYFERREGRLPVRLRRKVLAASPATLDRLLAKARCETPRRGLGGTKPGSLLRTMIPIHSGPWAVDRPGWLEADTVAHCGSSLAGEFIWSVTYTDICSQWTETRGLWGKGGAGVVARTREVEAELPFILLGFDSDNGSEFLNYHLWRYFAERAQPVQFMRSRPYHKNDNAHVEQKNWSHARQLLGYERLEWEALLEPINTLYAEVWGPLQNYFCPSLQLREKSKVGSRYQKKISPGANGVCAGAGLAGLPARQAPRTPGNAARNSTRWRYPPRRNGGWGKSLRWRGVPVALRAPSTPRQRNLPDSLNTLYFLCPSITQPLVSFSREATGQSRKRKPERARALKISCAINRAILCPSLRERPANGEAPQDRPSGSGEGEAARIDREYKPAKPSDERIRSACHRRKNRRRNVRCAPVLQQPSRLRETLGCKAGTRAGDGEAESDTRRIALNLVSRERRTAPGRLRCQGCAGGGGSPRQNRQNPLPKERGLLRRSRGRHYP